MTFYLNNCQGVSHEELYGPGAFFDLHVEGPNARRVAEIGTGDICVVASYDNNGRVVFDWHKYSKQTTETHPILREKVLVFWGKKYNTERLSKTKAARSRNYAVFFNVLGNFKRPSVVGKS